MNALHPGFVATGLGQRDNRFLAMLVRAAMWLRAEPGERGAETIVYLASAPERLRTAATISCNAVPRHPAVRRRMTRMRAGCGPRA